MVLRTCVQPIETWPSFEWPAGRLLLFPLTLPGGYKPLQQARLLREMMEKDADLPPGSRRIEPSDVLCVRLHEDCLTHPRAWGSDRLPDYNATWSFLREFGSRFRGVLVGQQLGVELSYRHCWGTWRGNAAGNVTAIAGFVREVGNDLREIGVTPWFSPMDWDVAQDAHEGDLRMLTALNEVGATAYIACGYTLVPGAYVKPEPVLMIGDQLRAQCKWTGLGWRLPELGEDLPVMRDYLQRGNFWSGLCGRAGLNNGNIQRLTAYGFKGFATKFEEFERAPMLAGLGEWWTDDWSWPLLRLRVSGSYTYRDHTHHQGELFMPGDRRERTYLLSIGGEHPIFEEV